MGLQGTALAGLCAIFALSSQISAATPWRSAMPSAGFSLPTAAQQNGSTLSPGQVTADGQVSITSKVYLWSGQLYEALPSLVVEHRLHKSLWPLGTRDFLGFGIATLGLFIAAGGGIGGGAILVPVYLIVLGEHWQRKRTCEVSKVHANNMDRQLMTVPTSSAPSTNIMDRRCLTSSPGPP